MLSYGNKEIAEYLRREVGCEKKIEKKTKEIF
jgi:hypothetical protein